MGARVLLADLADVGLSVAAAGSNLLIRPASKLTDDQRTALRAAKPDLLASHSAPPETARPYRLTLAEADAAQVEPWDNATIARFVGRVSLLVRRGLNASDTDEMADRLHLRDVREDDRVTCVESVLLRRGICPN
jgi:hypothetical protein